MVTTVTEAIHLINILLKYLPRERAKNMLEDMNFEIGQYTDNESLKESLVMVLKFLGKNNEV